MRGENKKTEGLQESQMINVIRSHCSKFCVYLVDEKIIHIISFLQGQQPQKSFTVFIQKFVAIHPILVDVSVCIKEMD